MTQPRIIVVIGTGTDVGKTHVVASLLAYGKARGLAVAGYKPVATGCTPRSEDADEHARAAGEPVIPPSFTYEKPVSAHLAAREEGRPVRLDVITKKARELASERHTLFVETAGGLFSPLSDTLTNVDLCRALPEARVLLVAPDRLGVLHDVRAALVAGATFGVKVDAVVLSAPAAADLSTGTNARELEGLGITRVAATFPRAAFSDATSHEAAARVYAALESST